MQLLYTAGYLAPKHLHKSRELHSVCAFANLGGQAVDLKINDTHGAIQTRSGIPSKLRKSRGMDVGKKSGIELVPIAPLSDQVQQCFLCPLSAADKVSSGPGPA